tara:strand:+ start:323 stop:952 length:630 start_codon:yes stop_codon:yes gene_type:complete
MPRKTPEENTREKVKDIIKQVLKNDYVELALKRVSFTESPDVDESVVCCEFFERTKKKEKTFQVDYRGRGAIDALWQLLMNHYSKNYSSLRTVFFRGFEIDTNLTTRRTKGSGSDAEVSVTLCLTNARKKDVAFRSRSRSILTSSVNAAFSAVEFYINSELAFKKLRNLIKNSKKRNRGDLTSTYMYQISEVVSVTSYDGLTENETLES